MLKIVIVDDEIRHIRGESYMPLLMA